MNVEEHLLTTLNEECLEVAKEVTKALRFGLDDRNPLIEDAPTQREMIIQEFHDLMGVYEMLEEHDIIPHVRDRARLEAKKKKVEKGLDYARCVSKVLTE